MALAVPTLFLAGDADTTFAPFLSDALAPLMPTARVARVPAAGHSVYFQRAELFNRLVGEFLKGAG
jgi:3-oxoadipate enol-lactonase